MSLRARIALLVTGAVLGAALAGMSAVRLVAEQRFRTLVQDSDRARAEALAPLVETLYTEQGGWDGMQQLVGAVIGMRGMMRDARGGRMPQMARAAVIGPLTRIVVADTRGLVVVDSDGSLLGTRHATTRVAEGVAVRVGGATVGSLFVGSMVDGALAQADTAFLASIARAIVVSALVAAGVAIVVGLLVAGRIAGPVRDLTRAAERAAAGDLDVRVRHAAGGEIGRLAAAFNTMAASLREQVEGRRRMIADSAHELRTPASLIQGTVEAMLDGVYATDRATLEGLHQETLRLSRLVGDLGELSLLEAGRLRIEPEPTDLVDLARRQIARFAESTREAGIEMEIHADAGPTQADVDPGRMGQVIANLLSNAIRHTPRGGRVSVTVGGAGPGLLSLRVDDTGPGIPEAERGRVFERYYRVDDSRSGEAGGRGLGLAIAAGIVRAHGGSIRAEASKLGGASLVVVVPRSR